VGHRTAEIAGSVRQIMQGMVAAGEDAIKAVFNS